MKRSLSIAAILLCFVGVREASATSFSFTTASGATGTADFVIGAGFLDVTITNTTGAGSPWLGSIADTITGVNFILVGGGSVTGLTSVTPIGALSCFGLNDGDVCTSVSPGPFPNNWKWGSNGNTPLTGLYVHQLKPYGILNSDVLSSDGIRAAANHNPLLLTTTFRLGTTGTVQYVSDVNMFFGTAGEFVSENEPPSTVPEPATLMLLAMGLILIAGRVQARKPRSIV